MKRISIVWLLATVCVTVVLAAMWVVTTSVLDKKQKDVRQDAEAYREERVRLAMWRLDTLAAAIVGEEDKRGAEAFDLPMFVLPGDTKMEHTNPLYANAPEHSNLYWSVTSKAENVVTPQVYPDSFVRKNNIDSTINGYNEVNYTKVKDILSNRLDDALRGELPQCDTNMDLSCVVAQLSVPVKQSESSWDQANDVEQSTFSQLAVQGDERGEKAVNMKNEPGVQQKLSQADTSKRRNAVNRISDNYTWGNTQQVIKRGNRSIQANGREDIVEIAPFQPVWLDGELMLVRKVTRYNGESVQGVWLNSNKVKQQLLAEVGDLFPHATLVPVVQDVTTILQNSQINRDNQTMLKLPYRFVPGEEPQVTINLGDLLRGPIGLAWLGTLLAVAAGFFMLSSVMKMSERRAAFVSAVTHELRTPLTTFRLYTDMLSSGMVKDEERKEAYLETLRRESERLTHLVENVLAYSRIERGSARARIEETAIGKLIERFEGRLQERAAEEQMKVILTIPPHCQDSLVKLDVTAVEQIIFNLVDNAVKYASGEGCGEEIHVFAGLKREDFVVSVADQGKGISARERRRLFKAFHKSVEEAAETKPGVGLGLALCRRLAKAMGGNLVLEASGNQSGATFVLTLPQKK